MTAVEVTTELVSQFEAVQRFYGPDGRLLETRKLVSPRPGTASDYMHRHGRGDGMGNPRSTRFIDLTPSRGRVL